MITLVKGTYNLLDSLRFDTNMTCKIVECRIKKKQEDISTPLVTSNVVFTEITTTSSLGYVELDLSISPNLTGDAFMDFRVRGTNDLTKKFYITPFKIMVVPSLKP